MGFNQLFWEILLVGCDAKRPLIDGNNGTACGMGEPDALLLGGTQFWVLASRFI
jgi:hypothetical protein